MTIATDPIEQLPVERATLKALQDRQDKQAFSGVL